ncbi:uncharacterized protein BDR25DRAFT_363543 [Lindgomyces ingoldianus]|uniref:Uncharacterized protein n=1 Tax=Lindgomyces ingoldianus TaxID=673940 RepID=A0ACB6Q9H0_9PLEO|nr:uncharacterized protein BDR25DRAFT_363543 [Lindgomyces ingoldianus]KAF2462801.1 hypothetical protein BDR25DRAFT_363543 [Lindgomyces ingoldianus]
MRCVVQGCDTLYSDLIALLRKPGASSISEGGGILHAELGNPGMADHSSDIPEETVAGQVVSYLKMKSDTMGPSRRRVEAIVTGVNAHRGRLAAASSAEVGLEGNHINPKAAHYDGLDFLIMRDLALKLGASSKVENFMDERMRHLNPYQNDSALPGVGPHNGIVSE